MIFLFLYTLRTALISCVAIPLSLLAAVIVMDALGFTLNTMTLGGLAMAIGEVVDDAIIDVENIRDAEFGGNGYCRVYDSQIGRDSDSLQRNLFVCIPKDDVYIDLHLSKILFEPEQEQLLEAVLTSIRFVDKPSANAGTLQPNPPDGSVGNSRNVAKVSGTASSQRVLSHSCLTVQFSHDSKPMQPRYGSTTYAPTEGSSVPSDAGEIPLPASKQVYFVPIGDFPAQQLQNLSEYYRSTLNLAVQPLPPIPLDMNVVDSDRQQIIAEKLIDSLRSAFPKLANNVNAILIGFTSVDMYPVEMNWKFAFGWRVDHERSAVVSTARMDLHYPGEPSSVAQPEIRLRKMVTKDIGILYYRLPQSGNPRSVLYGGILGIQELDIVGEHF